MLRSSHAMALAAALVLAVTGCSTATPDDAVGQTSADGVKMGQGVTDDQIALGIITDTSGVFSAAGISLAHAQELYFDKINEAGGICGRQIEAIVKDGGYDVQKTVTQYAQLKDDVLTLPTVIGGPMNAALLPSYAKDKMLAIPASWSSALLSSPNIMLSGSASEFWSTNGIDFLLNEGLIKKGDPVGVVYMEGESGEAVLAGAEHAAETLGLKLIKQQVKPTATDMSGVITSFKSGGAKAIVMNTAPAMTAAVAGATEAAGLNVPLVAASGGAFNPGLLETAAADTLKKHLYIIDPWRMDDSDPEVKQLIEDFGTTYPDDQFNGNTVWGFGVAAATVDLLEAACEAKDLTRDGLMEALESADSIDSLGILVPLNYAEAGKSPAKASFISKVNPNGLGSQELLTQEPYVGTTAESYELN